MGPYARGRFGRDRAREKKRKKREAQVYLGC